MSFESIYDVTEEDEREFDILENPCKKCKCFYCYCNKGVKNEP